MPQVGIITVIHDKKDHLKFDVKWRFHKSFTSMLKPYDKDGNGKFNEKERASLAQNIIDYIKTLNYVTEVQYVKKDSQFDNKFLKLNITQKGKVSFEDGSLIFKYSFTVPIKLQKDYKLSLSYFDKGGNFAFMFADVVLKDYKDYYAIVPTYYQTYIYFFKDYQNEVEQIKERELNDEIANIDNSDRNVSSAPQEAIESNSKDNSDYEINGTLTPQIDSKTSNSSKFSLLEMLRTQLNGLKDRLKATLQDIKKKDSITSYFWLLLFSFLYGVLHAVGPGHGKTLVSSYFMQKRGFLF